MNKTIKFKNIKTVAMLLSFLAIVLVIILAFGSEILDRNYNNRLKTEKDFDGFNISEYRIKTVFGKKIKNRIIKKLDHNVFIGETDKQIGNGYYDVKTYIQKNKCIVICLNKLWKKFDESLYEESYVTEIAEGIKEILVIDVPLDKIYDYILSGYKIAKNTDNNGKYDKEYVLDLDEYVIKGKILEKEFVMSIYKK